MDSKHRHELEQNDLVVFLTHFNEWWNKYGQMTLLVVLVAVGAFTAMRFYNYNKAQAHEKAWGGLAQSTSPESYRATAAENKDSVKALAYLRGADLLLTQATLPQTKEESKADDTAVKSDDTTQTDDAAKTDDTTKADDSSTQVTVAAQQVQDPKVMLEDARAMYKAVVDDKTLHPVIRINGLLGLASVAEAQHDWDTASTAYDQAIELAGKEYPVLAQQASGRKARLAQIKTPVHFIKEMPKPAPKPVVKTDEPKAPSVKLDLSSPVLPDMKKDQKPAAGQ